MNSSVIKNRGEWRIVIAKGTEKRTLCHFYCPSPDPIHPYRASVEEDIQYLTLWRKPGRAAAIGRLAVLTLDVSGWCCKRAGEILKREKVRDGYQADEWPVIKGETWHRVISSWLHSKSENPHAVSWTINSGDTRLQWPASSQASKQAARLTVI